VVGETTNAALKLMIAVDLPWEDLKSAKVKGDQAGASMAKNPPLITYYDLILKYKKLQKE